MTALSARGGWLFENGLRLGLVPGIRLRREHFGGMAYDPGNGDTVELDRGAFRLLELAKKGVRFRDIRTILPAERLEHSLSDWKLGDVIHGLCELGLLMRLRDTEDDAPSGGASSESDAVRWPAGPRLSGPEIVHWAVTYRCEARCPDCYAERNRRSGAPELSADDAFRLVESVTAMGAFQLAIGGGEPLLRDDLARICGKASSSGLSVHVTTGCDGNGRIGDDLLENIACLHAGVRYEEQTAGELDGHIRRLGELARRVDRSGRAFGANLILSRTVLRGLEEFLTRLADRGIGRVTLLRYKPPALASRWTAEAPGNKEFLGIEDILSAFLNRNPGFSLRIDCALSFLHRRLPPRTAGLAVLQGCVAGSRILSVGSDGTAYPCSQLVHPRFVAGNLLSNPPDLLWRQSAILRRFDRRRSSSEYRRSARGICLAGDRCGGCPALSRDGFGPEPNCPQPLPRPRYMFGRDGRMGDLRRYLCGGGSITVGEYMDRYSVGQERAVAELRLHPDLMPASAGRRRKSSCYVSGDIVGEIQETIGTTEAGFAFAARDNITASIGLGPAPLYPDWLASRDPQSAPDAEQDDEFD